MKKTALIFLPIVFGIALWIIFGGKTELKNYPPQGNKVLMFGDSLVFGVGATEGNDLPSLIGREVGVSVINEGRSGDTTSSALSRLPDALSHKPDVAIILLGGNDALRRIPIAETEANLRTIISDFQSVGAVTVILGVRGGLLGDPYDTMYEDIAQSTGSVYVSDVLSGLFADSRYMSDGIHPNDKGYAKIAVRVIPLIKDILEKKY